MILKDFEWQCQIQKMEDLPNINELLDLLQTFIIKIKIRKMNCKIFAIDTESVGVGPNNQSALARVSIVDYQGEKVLDLYCKPSEPVS